MFEERDVESSNAEAVRMRTTLRRTSLPLQSVFSSRSHSHAICSVIASKSFRYELGSGFPPIVVDEKRIENSLPTFSRFSSLYPQLGFLSEAASCSIYSSGRSACRDRNGILERQGWVNSPQGSGTPNQ